MTTADPGSVPAESVVGCWATVRPVGLVGAVMVKLLELAALSDPSFAERVYGPWVSKERLLNDATPLLAAIVNVPAMAPGPVATESVMLELSPVTMFPNWSSTAIVTAGLIVSP